MKKNKNYKISKNQLRKILESYILTDESVKKNILKKIIIENLLFTYMGLPIKPGEKVKLPPGIGGTGLPPKGAKFLWVPQSGKNFLDLSNYSPLSLENISKSFTNVTQKAAGGSSSPPPNIPKGLKYIIDLIRSHPKKSIGIGIASLLLGSGGLSLLRKFSKQSVSPVPPNFQNKGIDPRLAAFGAGAGGAGALLLGYLLSKKRNPKEKKLED